MNGFERSKETPSAVHQSTQCRNNCKLSTTAQRNDEPRIHKQSHLCQICGRPVVRPASEAFGTVSEAFGESALHYSCRPHRARWPTSARRSDTNPINERRMIMVAQPFSKLVARNSLAAGWCFTQVRGESYCKRRGVRLALELNNESSDHSQE